MPYKDREKKNAWMRKKYAEDDAYRLKQDEKVRARVYARKIRVLTYYGKHKTLQCCWMGCDVVDPDMLSLDHINNDGAADRLRGVTGTSLYLRVERMVIRLIYRLCATTINGRKNL